MLRDAVARGGNRACRSTARSTNYRALGATAKHSSQNGPRDGTSDHLALVASFGHPTVGDRPLGTHGALYGNQRAVHLNSLHQEREIGALIGLRQFHQNGCPGGNTSAIGPNDLLRERCDKTIAGSIRDRTDLGIGFSY